MEHPRRGGAPAAPSGALRPSLRLRRSLRLRFSLRPSLRLSLSLSLSLLCSSASSASPASPWHRSRPRPSPQLPQQLAPRPYALRLRGSIQMRRGSPGVGTRPPAAPGASRSTTAPAGVLSRLLARPAARGRAGQRLHVCERIGRRRHRERQVGRALSRRAVRSRRSRLCVNYGEWSRARWLLACCHPR